MAHLPNVENLESRKSPALDSLATLHAWLDRNHAVLAWQTKQDTGAIPLVSCYLIKGYPILVTVFRNHRGWNIFVPSHLGNSIAMSLDAAAVALGDGVLGCRGLLPEDQK